MKNVIAMHQTFEKDDEDIRQQIVYFSDGEQTVRLEAKSKKFLKFLGQLTKDNIIRSTSANATDALLGELAVCTNRVEYAHWHSTNIEKGLPPEEIVIRYAQLSPDLFRKLSYRKDIADLKAAVSLRSALQQYHGDAMRRFKQVGRNLGAANLDDLQNDTMFSKALENLSELKSQMKAEDGLSFDTHVKKLALKVPEVNLFNNISGMKEPIIAATVVSCIGDIGRFDDVASLWHYMGQHVVDGRMPTRQKGVNIDWNPKGRTILHILGQCVIKNRNNPWRDYFDQARTREIEIHENKHPGCKTRDGHCTAMAARKTSKEILKRFYLAASNKEYVKNHNPILD